jgi:3-phosphoshikimate 1-carboxyvinyltransferase
MKSLRVTHPTKKVHVTIHLPSSKSITNRALVLQALFPSNIILQNVSDADDSVLMRHALQTKEQEINIKNAGTCMRFLTAFFASTNREVELYGDERMYKRPIRLLVDALRQLGADISYLKEEGFPPLKIRGKQLNGGKIHIDASISSQYITALMLVAPTFMEGLVIELSGEINSRSYIEMTVKLMNALGFEVTFEDTIITIFPQIKESIHRQINYTIESDWSSASYWYEIAALSEECDIRLHGLTSESLQGDARIAEHMKNFGVQTTYINAGATLSKMSVSTKSSLHIDLVSTPDLAPTLAVTAVAKGVPAILSGLKNLRIKESDRLDVLEIELKKCGADIRIKQDALIIAAGKYPKQKTIHISTYHDHRIAMAFAPLALKEDIIIQNPEVVIKSYPYFWDDLKVAAFQVHYTK